MKNQLDRANLLNKLHIKGDPLILFNIWDAGSAKAVEEIGAKAIATSSLSVAAAHGYADGEQIPFNLVLENIKRIIATVDIPLSIDLEGGYGCSVNQVQENVKQIINSGAVGINIEDQIIVGKGLYSTKEQCARIHAIRQLAENMCVPIFLNARTDLFLQTDSIKHDHTIFEQALERALAYAKSGASGIFVPGLKDIKYIEKLCKLSPIPVNIMMLPDMPSSKELAQLGVARISYGPSPYFQVIDTLKNKGRKAVSVS